MVLRSYQQRVVSAVEAGWAQFQRQLVVMPTGGGKTIVFAHLAHRSLPARTLILAHRDELIDQAISKLHGATGVMAQKEKAEWTAGLSAPVVVASVQTMQRRLAKWPTDHFGLVVADEAHHAISDSWQEVLRHFSGAHVLGVTATPDRGDKRNLGEYFEAVAAEVGLFDLIHEGYLSRISVKSLPLRIDLSGVKSVAGDFDQAALGHALEPYLDQIAAAIREHASFRRVLCFLPLIATSQKFVEACRAAGLTAEHIDGYDSERKSKLERFAAWDFDVLSNAMLLTEGFDDPGIDCVCVLRPTRSRPLFAQMIGRGTRTAQAKEDLLLLDFLWLHERHKVAKPAHLIASTDEEAETITRVAEETFKAGGLLGELDLSRIAGRATAQREENLRKRLAEHQHRRGKTISADEFALEMHQPDLADWEPTMAWERDPVSEKQAKVLVRAHIDMGTVKGKGHASRLIDLVFHRTKRTPASEAQKATMRRAGYAAWETASQEDARRFFASLRKR
jgi:superfamily II DNA or RNA helicase